MNDKFDLDMIIERKGVRVRPQILVAIDDDSRAVTELVLVAGGEILTRWQASDPDNS